MKQIFLTLLISFSTFAHASSDDDLIGIPPFAVEPVPYESIELLQKVAASEVALKNLELLRQAQYGLIGAKRQGSEMGHETLYFMFRNDFSGCTASFSLTYFPATDVLLYGQVASETGIPSAQASALFYPPCSSTAL